MRNLIKVEYLKLKTSLSFKMLLLAQVGICVLFIIIGLSDPSVDATVSGFEAFHMNLGQVEQNCLILSIFAGTFICSDISTKLMQLSITVGNKRKDIFISKILFYLIGAVILLSIMPIIMTSTYTIANGFGEPVTLELMLLLSKRYIAYLFLNIGLSSLAILIAYTFKNIVGATIGALLGTLSVVVMTQGAGLNALKYTIFGLARTVETLTLNSDFALAIIFSIAYFTFFTFFSYLVLKKSEF
ncbi:MAG: hypothetical protein ACRCW1_01200 [Anaerotignaceae bacterium]